MERFATLLSDRYRLDREIGAGGMATVYLAEDVRHHRRVALKVLRPELGAVLGTERFLSEIRVTANLQHPHLLPLFDSGEADGLLFYVMPYVEGESLRARLERERQLPVEDAIRIATSIAGALDYAHRNGIIHRDLKPENILLHDGEPLVADFGIALAISKAGGARVTQTGLSLGTPQYMSPEQATGDRIVDARSDIYSLAAVLYEMLVGDPPHTAGTTQGVIAKVLTEKPAPVRTYRESVPHHVDAAVTHALQKLPADRFASALEFAEMLQGTRLPPPPGPRVAHVAARRRTLLVGGAAAVGILGAAGFAAWPDRPEPPGFQFVLPLDSLAASSTVFTAIALSTTGRMLAFNACESTASPVYVREMDNLQARRLPGVEAMCGLEFAPDDKTLLFEAGDGSIRRVDLEGGAPTLITENGLSPASGDDGSVLFARARELWRVSTDGAPAELVGKVTGPDSAAEIQQPFVLPGSKAALVSINYGPGSPTFPQVAVVTFKDRTVRLLGMDGSAPRYVRDYIVAEGRAGAMIAVRFSLRTLQPSGEPVRLMTRGTIQTATYSVAANGTLAYQTYEERRRQLTVVRPGGVPRPLSTDTAYFRYPRASPDGSRIAVSVGAIGGYDAADETWESRIYDLAGNRTHTFQQARSPEWSTDGTAVYVTRRPWFVRRIELAGRGDTSTVYAGPDPAWHISPLHDGTLVLRLGEQSMRIARTVQGSDSVILIETRAMGQAVSPDGRWIALIPTVSPSTIIVRSLGSARPALRIAVNAGSPVWSHDGSTLYYRNATHVLAARLSFTRGPELVRTDTILDARDYENVGYQSNFAVLQNGDLVLSRVLDVPRRVVIITNWSDQLDAIMRRQPR